MLEIHEWEIILNVITLIVTVGSIGTLVWQSGKWITKRADKKNEELKEQSRAIAETMKEAADQRTYEVKQTTQAVLDTMKIESAQRDIKLRDYVANLADEYRQVNAKHINELEVKLALSQEELNKRMDTHERQTEAQIKTMDHNYIKGMEEIRTILQARSALLDELQKQSQYVNGNIASIRSDIADLQEDLLDVISKDDPPQTTRERIKANRLKRRRIESDRILQDERR